MALGENQSTLKYLQAVPVVASATVYGQAIRSSAGGCLHSIYISSHTGLTFKLWNSATGPANAIGSTYTAPAGSSVVNFTVPIEFSNGIWVTTSPILAHSDGAGGSGLTFNVN